MIQIGFIGLGGMGCLQADSFDRVRGCKVFAGADPSAACRKAFQARFPDAVVYDDYRRLLANPEIDGVVVAIPTGHHAAVATDVLKAGKPLLLEKPMARTVAECRKLNRLSETTGTLLMVGHCRRYDPHWGSWGTYVRSGRLGWPVLWRHTMAGSGPSSSWFMDEKLGGGPLLDGAIHNYDFANLIFGDPESVVASTIKLNPAVTAVDTGSAVVRYGCGGQLLVSWSWGTVGSYAHDIVGPKGFIEPTPENLAVPGDTDGTYAYCRVTSMKGKQRLIRSRNSPDMFVRQAKHFLDCVRGKAECQTPGTEAIKAVAVGEAILQAGPDGKARKVVW